MANNVTVGYEGLQQAANRLTSGRQELVTTLRELQSVIDGLTSGGYRTRVASRRFGQRYRQWTRSAEDLLSSIDDISRAIKDAQQKHEQADQALAAGVAGVGGAGAGGAVAAARRGGAGTAGSSPTGSSPTSGGRPPNGGGVGGSPAGAGPGTGTATGSPGAERRTARGEETATPHREPSPHHRASGTPEEPHGNAGGQMRADLAVQNKNADVLAQNGYDVRHQPKELPPHVDRPGVPATADYRIGDRYYEHKVPHTTNVRNFVDNNLEKGAAAFRRNGTQAERFVVDLSNGQITPEQLRAEIVARATSEQGTGVQEVIAIQNGTVIPLYP